MGALQTMPLLGRDGELERLKAVLDELPAGGSPAVVVEGEPGIGKTRLLAELAELALARGGSVAVGRAAEFETTLPFAAFVDALDDQADAARELAAADLAELARVLPSLDTPADAGAGLIDERHRVHAAMRRLLALLARDGLFVLVLDDLHWADASSVEMIGALLRRPPPGEVLLALGFRPQQVSERLRADVSSAERERRAESIRLGPLGAEATARLAGEADGAAIFEQSGGNPFYIEQLAKSSKATVASSADGLAGEVPPAVAAALDEELRALAPDVRLVLQGAAIAGAEFEPQLVADAAGLTLGAVLRGLDDLLEAGLIRAASSPATFTVRHPLVRRAIYQGAGPAWRLAAHGRAYDALRTRGVPAEALAHHVALSATQGDDGAVALLTEAAAATRARAPATAADWLARAVELLPVGATERRRRLTIDLAEARVGSGRLELARASMLEALEHTTDVTERTRLIVRCARTELLIGRLEDAKRRLHAALDELPSIRMLEQLELKVALATSAFLALDIPEMLQWSRSVLEEGEEHGLHAHACAGAGLLSMGEAFSKRTGAAREASDRGQRLFATLSDEQLAGCLAAAEWLATANMYIERFEEAVEQADRGIALAKATNRGVRVPALAVASGFAATMLGRVADASAVTEDAVDAARLMDSPFSLAWVLMNAAVASWLGGDIVRARRQAMEVVERLKALDDTILTPNARTLVAQIELDGGDHRFAAKVLLEAGGGPELPLVGGFWQIFVFESLARAQVACGRLPEARDAAERAMAAAPPLELELTLGVAKRALALVTLEEGDAAGALQLAHEAAAAAEAVGARIEAARARVLAGRAYVPMGRRDEALDELRAAAAAFDECGARREAEDARGILHRLGEVRRVTARGETGTLGLEALTGRESEIAELVWDRRTNREIAEALFLSPKTVETHLRNIFAKVGVASRVELAREVERSRIVL